MTIENITPEVWTHRVAESNLNAMNKTHQYPRFEKSYIINCLEYVEPICDADCFCRNIENTGVWAIRSNLTFPVFLDYYAKLWVRGSAEFINKVNNIELQVGRRLKNAVFLLRAISAQWDSWEGNGNSLPQLANQLRYCYFCDNGFQQINQLCAQILAISNDTTGVYTSKLISQLFPDIAIPFDTKSGNKMRRCGYEPNDYGNGLLKSHVINFIDHNNLLMNAFRGLDNAPQLHWDGGLEYRPSPHT
jgi:hypothetical protein